MVGGNGNRTGNDAVDAGAFAVRAAGAEVGPELSAEVGAGIHLRKPTRRCRVANPPHGDRVSFLPMSDAQRAQLIHIDVDRRLGHEWDEWDGKPLPNEGNYSSPPALFFGWSALAMAVALGILALVVYTLAPHLTRLAESLPTYAWLTLGAVSGILWLWWGALLLSYVVRRPLLPEGLAERGPFLRLMRLTSRVADRFGKRDWVENAAVKVYNALVLERKRKVGKGEAAPADPAVSLPGHPGRRAAGGREVRRPRLRRHSRPACPPGDP